MANGEKYVDINGRPLNLLGYVFCGLQVGENYVQKARILIAESGTNSILGREWLSLLRYKFVPQIEKGESIVIFIENEKLSEETKQYIKEFSKLFSSNGRITSHQTKSKIENGAKILQQKGRRFPVQLQKSVDQEIKQ